MSCDRRWFWKHSASSLTDCGDTGRDYSFIKPNVPVPDPSRPEPKSRSYGGAWKRLVASITSLGADVTRTPITPIKHYPVVARWRRDTDFVAAGIYCFQPQVVNGEIDPPANPLLCAQPCARFTDLDNVGWTSRHFSGFVMIGLQAFNPSGQEVVFWKDACVRANLHWLIHELGISATRITLVEDIWAGGGNLGPSVEYFVDGLELGNMVFMQYKVVGDALVELDRRVIDVGIGLERIPWLLTGSMTSYQLVFPHALVFLSEQLGVDLSPQVWREFAPYAARFNLDENTDVAGTWASVAEALNFPGGASALRTALTPLRNLYILCDHIRTLLWAISDGALPSNVGGGSNLRRMFRRVRNVLMSERTADGVLWWEALGRAAQQTGSPSKASGVTGSVLSQPTAPPQTDSPAALLAAGMVALLDQVKKDLAGLYPDAEYLDSALFQDIFTVEAERAHQTDAQLTVRLKRLLKKRKTPNAFTTDDWVDLVAAGYLPQAALRQLRALSGLPSLELPLELDEGLARRGIRTLETGVVRVQPPPVYDTEGLVTRELFYEGSGSQFNFDAKVVALYPCVRPADTAAQPRGYQIVVLDQTRFYPTSGGQAHDIGSLTVVGETYRVVNVDRIGKAILHFLDRPLVQAGLPPPPVSDDPAAAMQGLHDSALLGGWPVSGCVDAARRIQLRQNHTATHIMCAAARSVLGPHIWQHGAKKRPAYATLDITHFRSLTPQEERAIEHRTNAIIMSAVSIHKATLQKNEAERIYGFTLYQGGVVPGDEVRVVRIGDSPEAPGGHIIDVEACCGTHCDNTAEVGFVYFIRSVRISDGVVRLFFTAGARALELYSAERSALGDVLRQYNVRLRDLSGLIRKFHASHLAIDRLRKKPFDILLRTLACSPLPTGPGASQITPGMYLTDSFDNPRLILSALKTQTAALARAHRSVAVLGPSWFVAFVSPPLVAAAPTKQRKKQKQSSPGDVPSAPPGWPPKLVAVHSLYISEPAARLTVRPVVGAGYEVKAIKISSSTPLLDWLAAHPSFWTQIPT